MTVEAKVSREQRAYWEWGMERKGRGWEMWGAQDIIPTV